MCKNEVVIQLYTELVTSQIVNTPSKYQKQIEKYLVLHHSTQQTSGHQHKIMELLYSIYNGLIAKKSPNTLDMIETFKKSVPHLDKRPDKE
jgi:hypothetical protein